MKRCREAPEHDEINENDQMIINNTDTPSSSESNDPQQQIIKNEPSSKKQAVNQSTESYYTLGCKYMDGSGVEKDSEKAFEWFSKGAEQGCLESIHKVGYFYHHGLGVEQDYKKAMEWYLKAADRNLAKSQNNIGVLYRSGEGVAKDLSKSMEWYLKAAENGNEIAQFNIGASYDKGVGVEQDKPKSFEWYLKSAKNGYAKAQFNVACAYDYAEGVEKDLSKAVEWYLRAAKNGHADAQFNVGWSYENGEGIEKDYAKAMTWYLTASENGNTDSYTNIGFLYRNGRGVEKNLEKAFEWYMKGAEKDVKQSQNNVANAYSNGYGVEKDLKKALFWRLKSVNTNNFKFIENPNDQFVIEDLHNEDLQIIDENDMELVIIRFEERDFRLSKMYLKKSKYLSTMLSSNWKDFNEKDENQIILDLRPIENDIFQEPTNHIQVFDTYVNYLTSDTVSITDFDMKFKLIELARYLGDDECILKIVKEASILLRFCILFKLDRIEQIHIAIASCFAVGPSLTITDLSENSLELLLNQSEITSLAKQKILKAFIKKFKKFPNSTVFSKFILTFIY
ncbi:predicted protein [Naegleria gruberi]|uniref:Predicted protein n=1 Tax=Naegleria gruberi TaxID=5762 RepID=D2VWD7_NAEGR|nr:uncharacterized protein NAEGRDRAFT_59403 [Naegleria gruberi]EFC38880.1 predicted protein [Naegleria gruberi]|eukprot:XP_002671624.1 predicted protein [Naegleria gruberi strain NEG-M]